MQDTLNKLRGKLIVSCQALPDEPLYGPTFMRAMALAASAGGAGGIRANGPEDVAAIRAAVDLPIIGIQKDRQSGFPVFITPTYDDARGVAVAGADVIALDGSALPRPRGETLPDIVARIHGELGLPVMADISCMDDARFSAQAGVDIIATTLSGYTAHGRPALPGPDLDLISELAQAFDTPIIAEGRFHEPAQVVEALNRGAFAVVVGGAITRPGEITRRFVGAITRR